jgi:gliding motility-associated-like protein
LIRFKGFIWFIFSCTFSAAFAVPNPVTLTCVTVENDSTVNVSWTQSDLNVVDFESYLVYVKNTPTSAFTLAATINNIATTTYIDDNNNAGINRLSYHVVVKGNQSANDLSVPSNEFTTIYLEIQIPDKKGVAELYWNNMHEDTESVINKKYPNQAWSVLFAPASGILTYNDTIINICIDTLGYQVQQTVNGCSSVSNRVFNQFVNWVAPTTPKTTFVTVNQDQKLARIEWGKPPEIDTEGYLIYYATETGLGVDSVKDVNQLYFDHTTSGVYDSSVTYQIEAYDNCKHILINGKYEANSSSPDELNHHSIFLSYQRPACAKYIEFNWNNYVNWMPDVSDYYLMIENEDSGELDSIRFDPGLTNYSYPLNTLPFNINYRFWIKATNGTFSSISNDIKYLFLENENASPPYLSSFDTRNDNNWLINGYVGNANNASIYILQQNMNQWQTISAINVDENIFFFQIPPPLNDSIGLYRVGAINKCGTDTVFSNEFTNIHLSGNANELNVRNELEWNLFNGWDDVPQEYELLKQDIYSTNFNLLVSMVSTETDYNDNLIDQMKLPGSLCYYITAVEKPNNYPVQGKIYSNIICVNQPHHIYIPSAFTVNGLNPIFKVEGVFLDFTQFGFQIIDRWGNSMFNTNDINEGWDGTSKGNAAPQGLYVYSVSYRDAKGAYYFKTGTVTLLK